MDYDPKLPPSGFQYSILGKHTVIKAESESLGPGPNKYNVRDIDHIFSHSPHWSLGQKLDNDLKGSFKLFKKRTGILFICYTATSNPSPNAYNPSDKTFGMDGRAYTISGWFQTNTNETPGPDRYFPKPSSLPLAGANPQYSFGLKPQKKRIESNIQYKCI